MELKSCCFSFSCKLILLLFPLFCVCTATILSGIALKEQEDEKEAKPVNRLKELEAKMNENLSEDYTPNQALQHAAEHGDLDAIRQQLKNAADINLPDNGPIIPPGKKADDPIYKHAIVTGDCALHKAAQNGHVEAVNLLFLSDAQLENKDRLGSTALHRAVSHNQIAVVRKLLEPGLDADLFARNNIGNTPIHIASYCGYLEIAKVLLEHGAYRLKDTPNRVGMTPLDYARKAAMHDLIQNYRPGMSSSQIIRESKDSLPTAGVGAPASTLIMQVPNNPYASAVSDIKKLDLDQRGNRKTSDFGEPVTIRWWGDDGRRVV